MSLKVNEIFYSIQGESLFAGLACTFIRLAGCNLRCSYCDTRYAYDAGAEMTIGEIIDRIALYSCSLVEITGGEPLVQPETLVLISQLIDRKFEVLLETNGTIDIGPVPSPCIRIMDVKCPSSGVSDQNKLENLAKLGPLDQLKFVIGDLTDYRFAKMLLNRLDPAFPLRQVLFSLS